MMNSSSISVMKVRDILLVTVPSDPDDATINHLQDSVLDSMLQFESKGLILDLTTVETVDSFFARTLIETAQMVTLMGGLTIIAGMRAGVAITATELGLTLGNIVTALDVDRALDILDDSDSLQEGGPDDQ